MVRSILQYSAFLESTFLGPLSFLPFPLPFTLPLLSPRPTAVAAERTAAEGH